MGTKNNIPVSSKSRALLFTLSFSLRREQRKTVVSSIHIQLTVKNLAKKTINEYKETGQYLTYQGTSFEVLCLEDNFNIELFKEPMSTLHVKNFNPRFFTQAGSEERESHTI